MTEIKTNQMKGFKMALPFLAGVAAGALAMIAWNKRDKVKECAFSGLKKGKETADKIYAKGKKEVSELVNKPKRGRKKATSEKVAKEPTKRRGRAKRVVVEPVIAPEQA